VRPIVFHPKARDAIRRFPKEVRLRLGKGLYRLQSGEQIGMPNSRPMPAVAAGVSELRVKNKDGAYRAFYYMGSTRGVIVFHALVKKTQQTPLLELELARKRLKEVLDAQN
jgi:phage-related protein